MRFCRIMQNDMADTVLVTTANHTQQAVHMWYLAAQRSIPQHSTAQHSTAQHSSYLGRAF